MVSLGEGHTPLVESVNIGPKLGIRLFFKLEMCNPTGSYKDRFVAAELNHLLRQGRSACLATSSGNTGSSLAAYCARYGVQCAIFVNQHAPAGKLMQMQAHGARLFRVKDFITSPLVTAQVYQRLGKMAEALNAPLIVSAYRHCPEGMAGVEAIAMEIAAANIAAGHIFVPVGGGGLFTAIARGVRSAGSARIKVHAVQPEGCATVVSAYAENRNEIVPLDSTTRISGLAVPFDIDATAALQELRRGEGLGIAIGDEEVFDAQQRMIREEGIWPEPAGAAALAGCLRVCREGHLPKGETVVCIVSGHGFKDPDSLQAAIQDNPDTFIDVDDIDSSLLEART
jgi:threonine synthase